MGRQIDELSRRVAMATSRREALGVFVSGLIAMVTPACPNPIAPTTRARSGLEQCGSFGALYCNSASVPWDLEGNVPGTCCYLISGRGAVGYLCAYGSNRVPAGCFATVEDARAACPNAPSIVRCTS